MNRTARIGALVAISALVGACGSQSYNTDGEAIYHTGKTVAGKTIETIVDKSGLPDPDMVLACAGCHADDAQGGKNTIPAFGPYVAPAITWDALTSNRDGVAYTEQSFVATLQSGIAPEGYRLHHPMPTWNVTEEQARSIAEYLKTK